MKRAKTDTTDCAGKLENARSACRFPFLSSRLAGSCSTGRERQVFEVSQASSTFGYFLRYEGALDEAKQGGGKKERIWLALSSRLARREVIFFLLS